MKPTVIYQPGSNTIRQMPENYLIAVSSNEGKPARWIVDPDPACNPAIALKAFKLCFKHHNIKWGSGENFANLINYLI